MPFRPALVPTLFVALGLLILFSLGFWQLSRNGEALTRLASIEERQAVAAVSNAELIAGGDLFWRLADLDGTWVGEPMLMSGRFEFGGYGYDVVQAFQLVEGPTMLVNRGWIPRETWQATLADVESRPAREHVHGLLISVQPEPDPGFFRRLLGADHVPLEPLPASGGGPERFQKDAYPGMAIRVPGVLPWALVMGNALHDNQSKSDAVWPATGYRLAPKRVPHLQYAATWFLIAGTLITIWAIRGVQRGRELSGAQ